MQRQVYVQPAKTDDEANRRNAPPLITTGLLWIGNRKIGRIDRGEVFNLATNAKLATLDQNNELYSLDGQSLNLSLETVNGGGRLKPDSHPRAVAEFKKLAEG